MELVFNATPEDIKVFLEEAEELLQLLDEDLVRLERETENAPLLQEIFRIVHTLKGSSAALGHEKMARLSHAMESTLDKLRKSEAVVTTQTIDALLKGLDCLRVFAVEVRTSQDSGVEMDAVLALFVDTIPHPIARQEASPPPALAAESYPEATTEVVVELEQDEAFRAVRAWQILNELEGVGKVLGSAPTRDEIEQEKVNGSLKVYMAGPCEDERIEAAARQVPGTGNIKVISLRPASAEPEPRPSPPATVNGGSQGGLKSRLNQTVRIDVERLDNLINLVGELVIERTHLMQVSNIMGQQLSDDRLAGDLHETTLRVGRISDQLQEEVMKARLLPIDTVLSRLHRVVRDLARKSGKKVDFKVSGEDTELDRSVIEEIGDPLVHLLRNCVDHGIEAPAVRLQSGKPETGTILLKAGQEDNSIVIVVEDDGAGIDVNRVKAKAVERGQITWDIASKMPEAEALQLIFAPGLSTASTVTEVSGRGVGMDIVKSHIEKLSGSVDVDTDPGKSTRFVLRLPLTLAIIQALLVNVNDSVFALPVNGVAETMRVAQREIKSVARHDVILLRKNILPLLWMRRYLGMPAPTSLRQDEVFVVAVKAGDRMAGLVVDSLLGEQDIVVKPLGSFLGDTEGFAGATILGDGRVALIMDVPDLVRTVSIQSRVAELQAV